MNATTTSPVEIRRQVEQWIHDGSATPGFLLDLMANVCRQMAGKQRDFLVMKAWAKAARHAKDGSVLSNIALEGV